MTWTAGDVSGSQTLTSSDHIHETHVNELRVAADAAVTSLATKATDTAVLHKATNETVTGVKTFSIGKLLDNGNHVFDAAIFGVYGDDSHDDAAAIYTGIQAVNAAGGGILLLPNPSVAYSIASNFTVLDDVIIMGRGYNTLLNVDPGASVRIDGTDRAGLVNLHLDGVNQAGNDAVVNLKNTTDSFIKRCWITNANAFGVFIHSTGVDETSIVRLTGNRIQGRGNADVVGGGPTNSTGAVTSDIFLSKNYIEQDTTAPGSAGYPFAFDMVAATRIQLMGNNFKGQVAFGFEQFPLLDSAMVGNLVRPATGLLAGGLYVSSNSAATTADKGLTISGNTVNSGEVFLNASGSSKKISGVSITGNTIRPWSTQDGITLNNCSEGVVSGNVVVSANPVASFASGVHCINTDNFEIDGNEFASCNYGIQDSSNEPSIKIGKNGYTNIITANVTGGYQTETSSSYNIGNSTGSTTVNRAKGGHQTITQTGNITVVLTAGIIVGEVLVLEVVTAGFSQTWPSNFKKAGGSLAMTGTSTVEMRWDGTNWVETSRAVAVS